jgi:hypothetical protein
MSSVPPSSGSSSGSDVGSGVVLDQALVSAIGAAVQTAVSQATSQMQAQLNSLSEAVDKVQKSTTSDVDSETVVRSSIDPAVSQRNVEALRESALADCVEFRKACDALILRKISQDSDHHGAIPPIAPRSATGPGTSGS